MKRIVRILFVLLYLLALMASVVMIVKPGAAIFQYLIPLPMESCDPDTGYGYRCEVFLSGTIFPANKVVLYEDGERMLKSSRDYVTRTGDGSYTAEYTENGDYFIYLAPVGNGDPAVNEKSYRAYFGILFFQPAMGICYLIILLFGLSRFMLFVVPFGKESKGRITQPGGAWVLLDRFFSHQKSALSNILASLRSSLSSNASSFFGVWEKIFIDIGLAFCGLTFLEWLFLATGSSFMDKMNLGQRIEIWLLSISSLLVLEVAVLAILVLLSFLLRSVRIPEVPVLIAEMIPAVALSALIVLLTDNFTYVVFNFGILTSSGVIRVIYGVLLGILFLSIYSKRINHWGSTGKNPIRSVKDHLWTGFLLALGGIALVIGLQGYAPYNNEEPSTNQPGISAQDYPNILLIGTDGLSARNMSLYGYQRKTTPNLDRLAEDSLVVENAFTNSGISFGSIASIFTGKWPTRTGVLYPPNILEGKDALEHLPGILAREGYATVEIAVPHYVDAFNMNLQNGFDIVNETPAYTDPLIQTMRNYGLTTPAYFIYLLEKKISSRLFQAFHIDLVQNPFSIVTQPSSTRDDQEKIAQIIDHLSRSRKPLFIHAHLMGTHGPTFELQERTYSRDKEQTDWWMTDYYDDSILSFDQKIGMLVDYLKDSGKYENTILVILTDHSQQWENRERIPLLFHFPDDQYAGRIVANAQNIDIAPTIIQFLGWEVPEWMDGQSLLRIAPDRNRLIFSTRLDNGDVFENGEKIYLDVKELRPPFYQFRVLDLILCDRWFELDLRTSVLESGIIEGHTKPCTENELPPREEIIQSMILFLEKQGYDVSSLR